MILFHHAAIVQPASFAVGLIDAPAIHAPAEPIAKPRPYTSTDSAYWAGWNAAHEDADLAYPPLEYSDAERSAFSEGVRDALRQIDHEIEQARAATAFPDSAEIDAMYSVLETERRGSWGAHA